MITKNKLEELVQTYETSDFIKDDPIQFPHKFKKLEDIEIAAFVSSLLAYGNRKIFIKKLDDLFEIMQNKPLEFVLHFQDEPQLNPQLKPELNQKSRVGLLTHQQKSGAEKLKGFNYRFAKDIDIIEVFNILHKLYSKDGGLKKLFEHGFDSHSHLGEEGDKIPIMLQTVTDYFYSNVKNNVGPGFYHLIPNPANGGAMKRMNMFLRWMIRKPPVDLGVWDFISTSELLIPLDVHVARLSREMGLLKRSSNDFKAVLELTQNLKQIDAKDPVKFDFAIFGLGVNNSM